MNCWQILGIEPTDDLALVRRAYAQKTRSCHPEEDPEGFDRLHGAFQEATRLARRSRRPDEAGPAPAGGPAARGAVLTGSRESCLAAERAAYLAWKKQNSSAARQTDAGDTFDFSAAAGAPRRAPARSREPGDEGEKPPAAQPQFDFEHLPQQASRQRRQWARALVDQLRAACSPDADRWQAKDLLESEEFRELQHVPEFLEMLTRLLREEPAFLEKLAVDLGYAYALPKSGERSGPAPDAAHEELFALLRPLWQTHWRKAEEQNAREAARPRNTAALAVGMCAVAGLLAVLEDLHIVLRLPLALLGGAAGVVAAMLVQCMQARRWLPSTRVLVLRAFQLVFLALVFFNVGFVGAACLLACYLAADLPGRKWYFRLSKAARFTLTAVCGALAVLWVPVSALLLPDVTTNVAFAAIFSWCILPLAFIRCIVSNRRFYKLAARFGL